MNEMNNPLLVRPGGRQGAGGVERGAWGMEHGAWGGFVIRIKSYRTVVLNFILKAIGFSQWL